MILQNLANEFFATQTNLSINESNPTRCTVCSIDQRIVQAKPRVKWVRTVQLLKFFQRNFSSPPKCWLVFPTDQHSIQNDLEVSFIMLFNRHH